MPDIKLLCTLRITCYLLGEPHEGRKFNSKTIEESNNPRCKTIEAPWNETETMGTCDGKINMPDYFRPSANKLAHKE